MEECSKFPRFLMEEASTADKVTKVSNSESCSRGRHTPQTYRRAFFVVVTFTLFAASWRARSKHSPTCSSHFFIFFTISVRKFLHIISVRDSLHITSLPSLYINITIHHKLSITVQQRDPPSQFLHLSIITPHQQHNHTRTSASLHLTTSAPSAIMADATDR